ncbi:MAG TPA: P1 family peptidase [Phycicoccus sp.]|nr:P1 family peptidase [Phycicoccus sp.]HQH06639.1 P1 family peptidase [Phycicoccus sp.]HQK31584.1 P1 family peptidase [Phycicoccus sp.]HQY96848.1 P1 family peptidase [Phycicoccus sp.]
MRPGTHNAITDVDGIRVGHTTLDEPGWLTGCSVVVPPPGTVCGVDVRGGGPGTRETDLLDPRNMVDAVDAVVLSGGSAFGLAAADGVAQAVYAAGLGWPVGPPPQRVPIVPAAILFDLGRGGEWLHHPQPADGEAAYAVAAAGAVAQGAVGAGTGAQAGGLKGGIGSASAVLESGVTVGALVAINAVGSPVDPHSGELLGRRLGLAGEFDDVAPANLQAAQGYWAQRAAGAAAMRAAMATTIGVVATDATLTKAQCQKLAGVCHDGMARAISPVHTAYDGDTLFALATGARPAPNGLDLVDLQTAAADCVSRAIVHAMLAATSVDRSADGGLVARSWLDALT